ncbi:MAG TPA: PilZ domain-containing protein [Trichormus sp.]|jgi:c-di-GMP-binding flagellar brake protein YcgR
MFESGKVYKVKVEATPGEIGFGRATVVERSTGQVSIQLRTSKELNANLPKGTRIWFVNDSTDNTFNGLWASNVIGGQTTGGKSVIICSTPKLEQTGVQRRRAPRVTLDVAVKVFVSDEEVDGEVRSKDISRSGIALEAVPPLSKEIEPGDHIKIVVQASVGNIEAVARVIRVDKNWLANKVVIGLEYTEVQPHAVALLDQLLVLLGGRPRHAQEEPPKDARSQGATGGTKKKGLSSWISSDSEGRGKFVGSKPSPTDDSDPQAASEEGTDEDEQE